MSDWRTCKTHPDVNGATQWGCPDCVRALREQLNARWERHEALEAELATLKNALRAWLVLLLAGALTSVVSAARR